jgi:hypothetical protein
MKIKLSFLGVLLITAIGFQSAFAASCSAICAESTEAQGLLHTSTLTATGSDAQTILDQLRGKCKDSLGHTVFVDLFLFEWDASYFPDENSSIVRKYDYSTDFPEDVGAVSTPFATVANACR